MICGDDSNVPHRQVGVSVGTVTVGSHDVFLVVRRSTQVLYEESRERTVMGGPMLQHWGGGWALRSQTGPTRRCRSQSRHTGLDSKQSR